MQLTKSSKILQGNYFEKVLANLRQLQRKKKQRELTHPIVHISYALNRININEAKGMLDFITELDIEYLSLYNYHDYGFKEVAFKKEEYELANRKIDEIYLLNLCLIFLSHSYSQETKH